jgi:membrane-associated phospholipid phosphatase
VDALARVDRGLLLALNHHAAHGLAARGVALAAALGGRGAVWLCLYALIFLLGGRRGRRLAVTGLCALGAADLMAQFLLKGLAERAPPLADLGPALHPLGAVPAGFSFPSAQAAMAFAAAPLLARQGPAWAAVAWLLALLVAAARVAAGLRYPSDVLGGLVVGLLAARLTVWALGEPLRRRVPRAVRGAARPPARPPG